MTYTLFQATLDLARRLGDVFESSATSGTTQTVVDSMLFQAAGWFADYPRGSLWLMITTKATKVITTHSGSTITFTPGQGSAVLAGDKYAAAPGAYPLYALKQAINMALRDIGKIPAEKQVTAVAAQETYTSADDTVFDEDIIGVEVANNASAPYYWTPHGRWHQVPSTPRSLVFDEGSAPANAYKMRILYLADHSELSADSDQISSDIHPNRLLAHAAVHALRWRLERTKMDDPTVPQLLNEAKEQVAGFVAMVQQQLAQAQVDQAQMAAQYPVRRTYRPRMARW